MIADLTLSQLGEVGRQALDGRRISNVQRLAGSHRNNNLLIKVDGGDSYVLRRYRQPGTAAVENALLDLLGGRVPVPEVVFADPEGAMLGQPMLIYRYVPGVMAGEVLSDMDEGATIGAAIGATLATIGTVTFERPGLFTGPSLWPDPQRMPKDLPSWMDECLRRGNAARVLSADEMAGLRRLAERAAPLLAPVAADAALVHSDFNGKNLLVEPRDHGWQVTAVLDWEFAHSGSPLTDVANMLRFPDELPSGFAEAFIDAYAAAGGRLVEDWWRVAHALDLYALAEFLTRPVDNPYFARAVRLLRAQL